MCPLVIMPCVYRFGTHKARPIRRTQRGMGLTEMVVVFPVALLLMLAILQMVLLFHAKGQAKHATFEAARQGALVHASEQSIRDGLAKGLMPYMGGGQNPAEIALSMALAASEAAPENAQIEIISPTQQSFDDYASPAEAKRLEKENGQPPPDLVIPNLNIAGKTCPEDKPGCAGDPHKNKSGQSLQDANLLKLRIVWGVPDRKQVPLAGPAIRAIMSLDTDQPAFHKALLARGRIPVVTTALVRMQSEPIRNALMVQALPQPASGEQGPGGPASGASQPEPPASGASSADSPATPGSGPANPGNNNGPGCPPDTPASNPAAVTQQAPLNSHSHPHV